MGGLATLDEFKSSPRSLNQNSVVLALESEAQSPSDLVQGQIGAGRNLYRIDPVGLLTVDQLEFLGIEENTRQQDQARKNPRTSQSLH